MKLFHLSDLHLGKRLLEFSLLEDQQYILDQILTLAELHHPDGVILAGDIYDKSVPSAEAVALFDDFLTQLSHLTPAVFLISGNHDSPERIAFGGRLMREAGIYTAPVFSGSPECVSLRDEYGPVDFYLLPFLKPTHVRRFYPEEALNSYTDALATALRGLPRNPQNRSVLVTHQFVTGASRSDSEEIAVGGSDNVDASVFDGFSYVALGHIHGPQNVAGNRVRYCGTPLKYSFSEAGQEKSVTLVELGADGIPVLSTLPLIPKRDLRELRGKYNDLTVREFYEHSSREDYLHITLTDEEDIPNALGRLRVIYPNLMKLSYDNLRTRQSQDLETPSMEALSPLELFAGLYEKQNNSPLTECQQQYLRHSLEALKEADQ